VFLKKTLHDLKSLKYKVINTRKLNRSGIPGNVQEHILGYLSQLKMQYYGEPR